MTQEQLLDIQARIAGRKTPSQMRDEPAETRTRRGQKYSNERVTDQGMTFDSKAEHRRFLYLQTLERAGEISGLRTQVPFQLIPPTDKPSGGRERATTYRADFTYFDRKGVLVVEDVKGAVTPEFRIKRKLMLYRHGIEVKEIRS